VLRQFVHLRAVTLRIAPLPPESRTHARSTMRAILRSSAQRMRLVYIMGTPDDQDLALLSLSDHLEALTDILGASARCRELVVASAAADLVQAADRLDNLERACHDLGARLGVEVGMLDWAWG